MAKTTAGGAFPSDEFPPLPRHDKPGIQPTHIEPNLTQYAKILNPKPNTPLIPKAPPKPIRDLRRSILGQCGIKSECTIGVLDQRHILIRLTTMEDYVHILSTAAFYVKAKETYWQMRTLKLDPWFEPEVETTIGEAIFSIASAVGKPLIVDMATKNQTRPSCPRVKIEVDLTATLPQRVKINEEDDNTGQIKSKWIKVQYDYIPKYCTECCLQGHDEHNCWALHLEFGKVIENKSNKQKWMISRKNRYIRDKIGCIEGDVNYHDENTFDALREEVETGPESKVDKIAEESTKEWVNKTFKESKKIVDQQTMTKQCEEKVGKPILQQEIEGESEQTQSLIQKDYDNQGEEIELNEEVVVADKGSIVVYGVDNEEILPLAVHNDDQNGGQEQKTNLDKGDLTSIINKVALEGDLSPKQVGKLKYTHTR
ncbi:hypothetical protein R3W88_025183 [Solanum pinnatisectum]|uniref:DUF4283 domain-containing protein n=1 Tax=Solanum pinnatisectum TaxID=50273 RepID=A0AAV9M5F3_9SOLN|nr:hypothetical protein R3W88_025183 [Solanum pinnatisectum]